MANKKGADEVVTAIITKKLFWFGQQMSAYRKLKGWDQAELGLRLGLSGDKGRANISRLENGKRSISFSSMVLLARVLGYDLGLTFTPISKTEAATIPAKVATGKTEPAVEKREVPQVFIPKVKKEEFVDIPSND